MVGFISSIKNENSERLSFYVAQFVILFMVDVIFVALTLILPNLLEVIYYLSVQCVILSSSNINDMFFFSFLCPFAVLFGLFATILVVFTSLYCFV